MLTGRGDEDVVEARLDDLERPDRDPGLIERSDDLGDVVDASVQLDEELPVALRQRRPKPAQTARPPRPAVGEPELEVRLADLRLQRCRGALGDDQPAADDPDPVRELVGLLEVLRGEEDRRALAVERRDLLPDRLAADRVEAGRRLVEKQHLGLVDQRRGEVEPPPHPARVGADPPVGGLG